MMIVGRIKKLGMENGSDMAKERIKCGSISMIMMGMIYRVVGMMGRLSIGDLKVSENGGIGLGEIRE